MTATFTLVDLVPGGTNMMVNAKWVSTWKTGANSEIFEAKARFAVKGFSQRYQIDFLEVFRLLRMLQQLLFSLRWQRSTDGILVILTGSRHSFSRVWGMRCI